MIGDFHAHLFHPRWYPERFQQAMLRDFQQRQGTVQKGAMPASAMVVRMLSDDNGTATIRIMDKVGIEKRIILVLDWGVELGEAEASIRTIHTDILSICQRFSDRLIGFAGIDPRRKDAVEVVSWAFESLGARGLKLHPTGGWSLTDPRTFEVVSLAAGHGFPVLVHLGKTVDVLSDRNAQPAPFLELARQFPEVPFIAGHSGFDLWETFMRNDVPANVYFDISGWQERIRGAGENIIEDMSRLHKAFPGRVCFGTDSPFYSFNLVLSEQRWLQRIFPQFSDSWAKLDPSSNSLLSGFRQAPRSTVERRTAA
jgi:hypothetical protein